MSLGNYILKEPGHQIVRVSDVLTWARWMEANHPSATRVGRTDVGGYIVSTIFLAIDYQFAPTGPPILWETMVYDPEHKSPSTGNPTLDSLPGIHDIQMERCPGSWEQSEEMHERIVCKLEEALGVTRQSTTTPD
jgi:hypothetical protein